MTTALYRARLTHRPNWRNRTRRLTRRHALWLLVIPIGLLALFCGLNVADDGVRYSASYAPEHTAP